VFTVSKVTNINAVVSSVEKIALKNKWGDFNWKICPPPVDISQCLPGKLRCGLAIRISRFGSRLRPRGELVAIDQPPLPPPAQFILRHAGSLVPAGDQ
jgi:hypothetical protein